MTELKRPKFINMGQGIVILINMIALYVGIVIIPNQLFEVMGIDLVLTIIGLILANDDVVEYESE